MIRLDQEQTKAMVAVHGWSGILLGLLLYAVILTGTAAVFAEEIGAWSAGHLAKGSAFEQPVDATVRRLTAMTPARDREALNLFEAGDRKLGAFFHHHATDAQGQPEERGVYYEADADGRIVRTATGSAEEIFGPDNDDALSHFLVDTHVRLHLPDPWGLILTGILGLALLIATFSGILIHRHLLKDIFTVRRRAHPVLAERDRHSVAGTWSLPFAFILAFTGSFFSFFGTIGVPVVALALFNGDVQALSNRVYGDAGIVDARAAPPGDLDTLIADATWRAGGAPTFLAIENYLRADAKVTSYHKPMSGDVEPVTLLYSGASGDFLRVKSVIGTTPSFGGTLTAIMGPLHFGNFAGLLSKAVWFALGFATCFVTYTGMRLWVIRRQTESRSLRWLDRLVMIVGLGLPLALLISAAGYFVAMPLGTATFWTPAAFLAASAVLTAIGFLARSSIMVERTLLGITAGTLVALPFLRMVVARGPGWGQALAAGQPVIMAMDIALIFSGLWLLVEGSRGHAPTPDRSVTTRRAYQE